MRTRVASSDWCASRQVVSVRCTRRFSLSQRTSPSGPRWSRICLVPGGGGAFMIAAGRCGTGGSVFSIAGGGLGLPRTVAWPLTTVAAT